jgi:hypothetical protein
MAPQSLNFEKKIVKFFGRNEFAKIIKANLSEGGP